jgi:Tol biopolymer transport system component
MRMPRGLRLSITVLSTLALAAGAATAGSALNTSRTAVGEIAFSVQHGDGDAPRDLYVVRTDGRWIFRKTTRLNEQDPVWSPDGRHIAFEGWTGYDPGDASVYTMNPDGTHRRRLAPGGAPQWSPDGRRIAYASDGIYVMNSDGTGKKRLTRSGGPPHWSPDGKQIAFTGGEFPEYDVYVVNAGGGRERRLTRTRDSTVAAWGPGRRIIFTVSQHEGPRGNFLGGPEGIYVVNADGTGRRKVKSTFSTLIGGWSPDAQLIVYAAHGISTVRPRDGFVRRLTRRSPGVDRDPAWSPDGRVIAFARRDTPRADGIWIVNRDGSGVRRIAVALLVGRLRWNDYSTPTWAPR